MTCWYSEWGRLLVSLWERTVTKTKIGASSNEEELRGNSFSCHRNQRVWKSLVLEPKCLLQTALLVQSGIKTFRHWCAGAWKSLRVHKYGSAYQIYISFTAAYSKGMLNNLHFHNSVGWQQLLLVLLTAGSLEVICKSMHFICFSLLFISMYLSSHK